MSDKEEAILKHIRKAYILAKATSVMLEAIKHDVSADLRKAALDAKAKNNYFIKLIDQSFEKRKVSKTFVEAEEELSFEFLDKLYESTV